MLGMILTAALATASVNPAGNATARAGSPVSRTDLQRHDLSIADREVVQARVDFAPNAVAAPHRHPGEEIIYVLQGVIEYRVDGRLPVTLRAGDVLFIPKSVIHAAANVGGSPASEIATYIVERGEPLIVPADPPKK